MGREAHDVPARFAAEGDVGRLQWEPPKLIFRGQVRRVFEGDDLKGLTVEGGDLVLAGAARFTLGEPFAERWAKAILEPRSRLDKLGVKAGQRVAVIDLDDEDFLNELSTRTLPVSDGDPVDLLFLAADSPEALGRIGAILPRLADRGALWIVSFKGPLLKVRDVDVMAAAKGFGLVDSKVVGFSDTRTALKFTRRR